jgi:uncharacterized membrane protein (DUF4010 family)
MRRLALGLAVAAAAVVVPAGAAGAAGPAPGAAGGEAGEAGEAGEIKLKNPFELGSAVKVTLVFAVVLLATKAATVYLGPRGLYLTSLLAGMTDVDAVTLSTAGLARDGIDAATATVAVVLAIAVNTAVKAALAGIVGGAALGRRTVLVGALVLAAGAAGLAAGAGLDLG